MFAVISSAGQLVGPIAGALLVGLLSWRWIFFVNIPIGLMVLVLTLRLIPKSVRRPAGSIDVGGVLTMALALLSAVLGITVLGTSRTTNALWQFAGFELLAGVALVAFWRHSIRAPDPFIPIRFLRARGFAVMNGINFLHGMLTFGIASLIPLYAENRYGLPTLQAGTLLTSRAVGMVGVGTIAALAVRRTGYRRPMALGFAVLAIAILLMSIAPMWGTSPFMWLTICLGIAGVGIGAVNPAASNACLHLEPDHVSTIIGLRYTFINLGVIVSVSVTTAILNRSRDPGITQAHLLWVAAGIIFAVLIPLILRVPEQ